MKKTNEYGHSDFLTHFTGALDEIQLAIAMNLGRGNLELTLDSHTYNFLHHQLSQKYGPDSLFFETSENSLQIAGPAGYIVINKGKDD